jgi:hypothetical protein
LLGKRKNPPEEIIEPVAINTSDHQSAISKNEDLEKLIRGL